LEANHELDGLRHPIVIKASTHPPTQIENQREVKPGIIREETTRGLHADCSSYLKAQGALFSGFPTQ